MISADLCCFPAVWKFESIGTVSEDFFFFFNLYTITVRICYCIVVNLRNDRILPYPTHTPISVMLPELVIFNLNSF